MVVTEVETPQQETRRAVKVRQKRASQIDRVIVLLLAASVFVVHDVGYMFSHPFWIDESWVADSTRAPIGLLPWLTSSTPLGWTLMLRAIPADGQDLRLLPLAFTVVSVVLAYYVGRELPFRIPRYMVGLLTGAAVLLVPAMLVRDDLKQYTAEACASMTILLLLARTENHWTRGRLVAIATLTAGGLLIANSVVFVGVAALIGLVLSTLVRREFRRTRDVVLALLGTLVASGVVYELIDARHVIPIQTSFWSPYYVPRNNGIGGALSYINLRADQLAPYLGWKYLAIDIALALIGIAGLIWIKHYALAAVVPITITLVTIASADRRFPFGDLRTSTFWLVMVAVLMAVGVGTLVAVFLNRNLVWALVAVALAIGVYVISVQPYIRSHPIANEDVRSQVLYVNSHRKPGDVVVVNYGAAWGFAYYEQELTPSFTHTGIATTGFLAAFPHVPWLIVMPNYDVHAAMRSAVERIESEPDRSSARIWIIRSFYIEPGWQAALPRHGVTTIPVGPEPLLVYRPF